MKSPSSLIDLLKRLWLHLGRYRQGQFGLLMCLMLVSAFAEVVSLGAVLPFLGILVAPEHVFNQVFIRGVVLALGITSADELVLPLTIAFIILALLTGVIRILLIWFSTRLAFASGADISIEVYRRTLYQPYRVHLSRNSSEVISGITNKVNTVVFAVMLPLLTLISSLVLLVAITFALIAIDPVVAIAATTVFGVSYGVITWFSRLHLRRYSQRIAYEQTQVVKALQEGMGGIRDVLLDGTQRVYCDIYSQSDQLLRRAQGNITFIGQSPRYLIEALGMVLIAALAYALSLRIGGMSTELPVLGALALGAQRMLPALQQSFSAWASITGSHASLANTVDLLDQPLSEKTLHLTSEPLLIKHAISFNAVHFRYHIDGPWVINDLNLTIPRGVRIGIVGITGSGKSTMLDLLMGLLSPSEGDLQVDGRSISGDIVQAWQRCIAHVPQSIYLADATLAENIAFGVPPSIIDLSRVQQAARQAQIAEFIERSPGGYEGRVGERGIRLSGGQRQRIGIARALYKQAKVLVFDEATSALDNATEKSVMDSIEGLNRDLTILIIAHRLSTVRRCDTIVELQNGRVMAQGTYEQLLQDSLSFREMAK
jgi:ABC-type multidrug transport system fused ATPase/permease subunit